MAEGESMVRARFFIEPKEEHNRVQHIGCRLAITEQMLQAGFTKGMVFNLPDGTVEIALEGAAKDIEAFHASVSEHLVSWLEHRTPDKEYLKKMIGNPGITVSKIEYKPTLRVLDIGLFSHSLEMDQLGKGVDIYYELTDAIKGLNHDLSDAVKGLNHAIEERKI
jgi:acylphosphatase